ncbi:MAG: aldolase/citrate lyase family protein [bacterium]
MIRFFLITNDPKLARQAEAAGVERIFVDLEKLGKQERQGHLNTHIAEHTFDDIANVKSVLNHSELLVRLNPLNRKTHWEVEEAIKHGADILMLPMYRTGEEVTEFIKMVDGRVKMIPLLETAGAVRSIKEVVKIRGVSEIYIGLNDLYLDMGLRFMFEPLANGLVDELAGIIRKSGLPFGFGGIARVGEGVIPGERVLGEHLRLGSSSVILSRTFQRDLRKSRRKGGPKSAYNPGVILTEQIRKLKSAYAKLELRNEKQINSDRQRLCQLVQAYIETKAVETPA